MYTVWKYPLTINDTFKIEMPKDAVILSVQMQNGYPCMWAHVNPGNKPFDLRHFQIVGTGNEAPPPGEIKQFIGTFQTGPFVFHLFEKGENEL